MFGTLDRAPYGQVAEAEAAKLALFLVSDGCEYWGRIHHRRRHDPGHLNSRATDETAAWFLAPAHSYLSTLPLHEWSIETDMTKRERVAAAVSGEPVDRAPASLWGHNFLREWSNDELVGETVEQYEAYDWDFIKINPRWSMFAEAWGGVYEPPVEQTPQTMVNAALESLDELHEVVAVHAERGVFGEHVESTRLVVERTGGEVDVIQTVFSPMSVLRLDARGAPARPQAGRRRGAGRGPRRNRADHRDDHQLQPRQPERRRERRLLRTAAVGEPPRTQRRTSTASSGVHMTYRCWTRSATPRSTSYTSATPTTCSPTARLPGRSRSTGTTATRPTPGLADVWAESDRAVMGGVSRTGLGDLSADEIGAQAGEAAAVGPSRVFVTGGCSIPPHTTHENRAAVAAAVRGG